MRRVTTRPINVTSPHGKRTSTSLNGWYVPEIRSDSVSLNSEIFRLRTGLQSLIRRCPKDSRSPKLTGGLARTASRKTNTTQWHFKRRALLRPASTTIASSTSSRNTCTSTQAAGPPVMRVQLRPTCSTIPTSHVRLIFALEAVIAYHLLPAFVDIMANKVQAARTVRSQFVVGEYNSVSCSGKVNLTDTFGQSLVRSHYTPLFVFQN